MHPNRPSSAQMRLAGYLAMCAAGALFVGCSPGIQWRDYAYDPERIAARRNNQLTFVYFRQWSSVECTDFEEKVLRDPRVLQATTGLYCVALEFAWDEKLARTWGLSAPPAVAIVDPQERVLASIQGPVSADELLKRLEQARQRFTEAARPAAP